MEKKKKHTHTHAHTHTLEGPFFCPLQKWSYLVERTARHWGHSSPALREKCEASLVPVRVDKSDQKHTPRQK